MHKQSILECTQAGEKMKVLVACERSDTLTFALRRKGIYAKSCDIEPSDHNSPYHIQDNVLNVINEGWDVMIAFPPCTYLANSGVRWLHNQPGRLDEMKKAIDFFNTILKADIPKIAVENPIQHGYAREYIRKYDQIIQPWEHGHGETKATCLWLKNLPLLKPTNIVSGRLHIIHNMPETKDRQKKRSTTYHGIAEAMATQWF